LWLVVRMVLPVEMTLGRGIKTGKTKKGVKFFQPGLWVAGAGTKRRRRKVVSHCKMDVLIW